MDTYTVYFDYVYLEGQNEVYLGALVIDQDGDEVQPLKIRQIEGQGPQNKYNLVYTTQAFNYAIIVAHEFQLEMVEFINQNKIVFDWVLSDEDTNRDYVDEAKQSMIEYLTEVDAVAGYNATIKGPQNKAKKQLNKIKKNKGLGDFKVAQQKGSFNKLKKAKQDKLTDKKVAKIHTEDRVPKVKIEHRKYGYKSNDD